MSGPAGTEKLPLFHGLEPAPIRAPALAVEAELDQVHPPLARLGDPTTSHEAAAAAKPEAEAENRAIYTALVVMGPDGGDAYAIAYHLNGRMHQGPWTDVIVNRRLAGLRQRRLAHRLWATSDGDGERPHGPAHIHIADCYRDRYAPDALMPEGTRGTKRRAA